ncbi:MAG: hypothetical protein EBS89_01610, partial [Proteobacteria bacterium]|nr:hypothetical protein [Pseudomonadota bacterium]
MATTMPDRAIDGATGPDTPPALADIRLQIDTVDRELVALLNRRARLSVEVDIASEFRYRQPEMPKGGV